MAADLTYLKPLVETIIRDKNRDWTIQGFGFLRTYFGPANNPKQFRLNLWHSRFTIPNVSTIHDHPWDFKSIVVVGRFENQRYELMQIKKPTHNYAILKTGVGGFLDREIKECCLSPEVPEIYYPGDEYSQKSNEIHETRFNDGSITLNKRTGDTEHARVFWNYGNNWVDAIPRKATPEEVKIAVEHSLDTWFK